ncbi:MAG: response regulator [Pseudobacteriovorax sp.]|nr:response regulator [Pseudobacteriovorax sp.]
MSKDEVTRENLRSAEGYRLLLMEDDESIVELVREGLSIADIRVTAVSNGFEAMEAFESHPFDMIVTDIMVKGFNGFQLIDYVLKKGVSVPIVVITGAYPNGFHQYAATLGIEDYFEKPFQLERFATRIIEILSQRDARPAKQAETA